MICTWQLCLLQNLVDKCRREKKLNHLRLARIRSERYRPPENKVLFFYVVSMNQRSVNYEFVFTTFASLSDVIIVI